jgi:hypothetical protein
MQELVDHATPAMATGNHSSSFIRDNAVPNFCLEKISKSWPHFSTNNNIKKEETARHAPFM